MALILLTRFLPRVFAFWLLCCTALLALGARQPANDDAWVSFGFLTCPLPCYAGITPGETAFNDTAALLTRHVPALDPRTIASGTSLNFFARVPSQQLGGLVRYQRGGQVGEVRLNAVLPIERLFAQMGAPDCILTAAGAENSTIIFWERGAISVAAVLGTDQDALRMGASSFALWLRVAAPPDCALRGARAWHGFAPLWVYKTNGSSR